MEVVQRLETFSTMLGLTEKQKLSVVSDGVKMATYGVIFEKILFLKIKR